MGSEYLFKPVKQYDISPNVDGAIAFVLAEEDTAKQLDVEPIWLKGFGWSSQTPWLSSRSFNADYARRSAKMAYKMAGVQDPQKEIDIAEVDDRFSFKELQHLEAVGLIEKGKAGEMIEEGILDKQGAVPTNVSGGSIGVGNCFEATGLQKALEIVIQLRGHAGKRQVKDTHQGLAQSWRGIPSGSGAVAVFGR
jgi:acetyl-CoA C-acetyltransferase